MLDDGDENGIEGAEVEAEGVELEAVAVVVTVATE